jgi:hypothetical protein
MSVPTEEFGYRMALKAAMLIFKVVYFGLVFPVKFATNYTNKLAKLKSKPVPPSANR